MRLIIILITLLVLGCNQPEIPVNSQLEANTQTDTITESKLTNDEFQKFPMADTILYKFFSNLNEVERYIDDNHGVFCLESSVGATPEIEQLFTKEDLMGKTSYMFLNRDIDLVLNKVFINPTDFDPCKDNLEGYYIFNLTEPQNVLQSIHEIKMIQDEKRKIDTLMPLLKNIDKHLNKSVVVGFTSKYGESITLRFYFSITNKNIRLKIIDLRECGV